MHYIVASSLPRDSENPIHNSLKDIIFFHIMFFTTFELETKFWEAHKFWESGVTSYYNLLLPSQNTTKKPLTVFALLNYSAYSLFFSFKRHQRICSTSLSGIFPLTNPLSSQEGICWAWFCCFTSILDQAHVHCFSEWLWNDTSFSRFKYLFQRNKLTHPDFSKLTSSKFLY